MTADVLRARLGPVGLVGKSESQPAPGAGAAVSRRWLKRGARLLCNAAVVVAIMALVPMAIVARRGDRLARFLDGQSWVASRHFGSPELARPLALPSDAAITPMQAGLAFNALQRRSTSAPGFDVIDQKDRPAFPWRTMTMAPGMFIGARTVEYPTPSVIHILMQARGGLSAQESEYLRALATAPVWREFDLVARAPAVDVAGGQFRIPFADQVTAEQRPMPSYADARELAYAAVSRAAYHRSIGQLDSAETILRSIVSFGFVFIDDAPEMMDGLVGARIVGIGRDAWLQFHVREYGVPAPPDPRARILQPVPAQPVREDPSSFTSEDVRRRLLARLADPLAARGTRFALARSLTVSSCTNVRDLLLGPRPEVRDALERTRRTLPRYAAERALLELQTRSLPGASGTVTTGPFQTLAVSAASVPGILTGNPRLEACTRLLTSW